MYRPKEIAYDVTMFMDNGMTFDKACQVIAKIYQIRKEDVEIAAICYDEELYILWSPNRRANQKTRNLPEEETPKRRETDG